MRVLAFARRVLAAGAEIPGQREDAEIGLCCIGMVAMVDPPWHGVAAVERAHHADIRLHIVTGDNGLTAAAIASQAAAVMLQWHLRPRFFPGPKALLRKTRFNGSRRHQQLPWRLRSGRSG